jgi:FkbM family methyltransferase
MAMLQGHFTLSVSGTDATFVATEREGVTVTLRRHRSEYDRLSHLLQNLHDDDVFFDIGANTGLYSSFASEHCSEVIAFEPYPPNIEELERNVELASGNIFIHPVALSDESGPVSLETEANDREDYPDPGSPTFGTATMKKDGEGSEIKSVRGDELIKQSLAPEPDVLKIDVEGSEPLVVEGLENTLSNGDCRLVYCEVHRPKSNRGSIRDHGVSEEDMILEFEDLGYNVTKVDSGGSDFLIIAERE